jgi:hypothetical protein
MTGNWRRLGLVYRPPGEGWALTHAQNPFAEDLGDKGLRCHFACRDERNRSRGACVDISWPSVVAPAGEPLSVVPRMTLDLGALGSFDDSGAMPSSIVSVAGRRYMYYTGWSLALTVPFSFHIGLAISEDDGATYERVSQAPVLGRNRHDPFICGAPWVLFENGFFRMWYSSATKWEVRAEGVRHFYTIKYAESADGIVWQTSPRLCFDYRSDEYALARPVVFRQDGFYRMLFSFRGGGDLYRVGSARSADGISWQREETTFLEAAPSGWDSEMACYAWPFAHDRRRYVLYNGNGYGREGFGCAQAEN